MKKQYNIRFEDEEMASIEAAVPGARTGTAVRIAAISYARQCEMKRERLVDGSSEARKNGEPGDNIAGNGTRE